MRSVLTACLVLSLSTTATAQPTPSVPPAEPMNSPPSASKFLRIEREFWETYGIRLGRPGQESLGPGFFMGNLAEAVRGSPEAERHARHAKITTALNLGFRLVGSGLLVASIITYSNDHGGLAGWPNFIRQRNEGVQAMALNLGWVMSLTGAWLCRELTFQEIMTSVNAYNFDLVQGRIR